jgi:hypothetical protein
MRARRSAPQPQTQEKEFVMRILKLSILLAVLLVEAIAPASALTPQERVLLLGPRPATTVAGGGYVGPGDLKTFKAWWGVRGYSAAYAAPGTNPGIDVVDTATGGFSCTVPIATTGKLDLVSNVCVGNTVNVVTFCTVTHAAGCSVTKMYDQTGGGNPITNPSGSTATIPTLTFNVYGTIPSVTYTAASIQKFTNPSTLTFSQSQPMMFSAVVMAATDGARTIIGSFSGDLTFGFGATTPPAKIVCRGWRRAWQFDCSQHKVSPQLCLERCEQRGSFERHHHQLWRFARSRSSDFRNKPAHYR